jgi:hypothetical protein
VLKLSPLSTTALRPNTVIPTGDDSIEMEVQIFKFKEDEEILSEVSQRVHDVCEIMEK